MKVFIKYDINIICKKVLKEQLDKLELKFNIVNQGEVDLNEKISDKKIEEINNTLNEYGIQIVENQKSILVQKIKEIINEMVYNEGKQPNLKSSVYLSEKLNYNYGYISNIFSEVTYTTIENYIILQKIERAKQLIIFEELTFTEIAYQLNYCSVAHFSTQFKNTTGLTPSTFVKIIAKRRENTQNAD